MFSIKHVYFIIFIVCIVVYSISFCGDDDEIVPQNTSTTTVAIQTTTTTSISSDTTTIETTTTTTTNPCYNDQFTGLIGGTSDCAGGTATYSNYTEDCGLSQVFSLIPTDNTTVEVNINVTNVVVTAVECWDAGWERATFWIQDRSGGIKCFLSAAPDNTFKVGDRVSFTIKRIGRYLGNPDIEVIENFIISSNTADNVYINDLTGSDISDNHINTIVRISGVISNPVSVGPQKKEWTLTHGNKTIVLRSAFASFNENDCVTFTGPLTIRNGIYVLDDKEFEWHVIN